MKKEGASPFRRGKIFKPKWLFVAVVIAALGVRICATTSRYDEIFNLWVSAATILGQQYLVENPYIFQMGDLWNLPFLFVFRECTGSFDGAVLFIRICYLCLNLLLAALVWYWLKRYAAEYPVVYFVLLIPTFAFGCIYSMSYDTAYLYFSLLASILLTASVLQTGQKRKTADILAFFSGISYACMVYAYPTMVLWVFSIFVAVGIWCWRQSRQHEKKVIFRPLFWVAAGGLVVLSAFLLYLAKVGVGNTIFAQGLSGSLMKSGRPLAAAGQAQGGAAVLTVISSVAKNTWDAALFLVDWNKSLYHVALPIFLLQWFIGLKTNWRWVRLSLLVEILAAGFAAQWGKSYLDYFDSLYFYAWVFIWGPLMCCYLRSPEHRKAASWLFCIAIIPSLVGFSAVANTAAYHVKAAEGIYLGALASFAIFCMTLSEQLETKKYRKAGLAVLAVCLVFFNMAAFYHNAYEGEVWGNCTYTMKSGLLKGIRVGESDAIYEQLQQTAAELVRPEDKIVYCSMVFTGGYFWTEKLAGQLPSSQSPSSKWADLLILTEDDAEKTAQFLEEYELKYSENGCQIYWRMTGTS